MRGKGMKCLGLVLCCSITSLAVSGCSGSKGNGKVTEIEIVQYKPEAANYFKMVEEQFNAEHDDIHLTTHTSHTQTTPETVYFKEFSSENSHAACAKPLATDKTLCK